jgi:serine protease Do
MRSSIMVNAFVPPDKDSPDPISAGAATVIEPGLAVISAHVIAGSTAVVYSQTNERGEHVMKTAKVVGVAPELDIALLQLEDATIPAAEKAPADPQDGDQIFVIGDAENHQWSKSFGFVTNTHVNLNAPVCDCIQTDAGINPGDSGGGAFDTQGRMSGMAEALFENRQSMGFIIPIAQLNEVVEHLKKGDLAARPFGLKLNTVDTLWAIANHTRDLDGALVKEDRAPLAQGDRIVAINGKRIGNPAVALTRIALTPAGEKLRFLVDRGGQRLTVEANR